MKSVHKPPAVLGSPPRGSLARGESGIAVVSALAAVGITAAICAGVALLLDNRSTEVYLAKRRQQQVDLGKSVLAQVSQPSSLLVSTLTSGALRACVDAAPSVCDVTDKSQPLGREFNAAAANFQLTGAAAVRSGPTIIYDIHGAVCATRRPDCLFQVSTFFRAVCPNHAVSCPQATEIQVRTVVRQATGARLKPKLNSPLFNHRLEDQPRSEGKLDVTFTTHTFVKDILGGAHQSCGEGSVQAGVDAQGMIKCECMPGYPKIGFDTALNQPICKTDSKCKVGEVFRGFQGASDPAPGRPICVRQDYLCQTETKNSNRLGRHRCNNPSLQLRATSANPFVGCTVSYPNRKDHINVDNPSLNCRPVRIACCEKARN